MALLGMFYINCTMECKDSYQKQEMLCWGSEWFKALHKSLNSFYLIITNDGNESNYVISPKSVAKDYILVLTSSLLNPTGEHLATPHSCI